MRLTLKFFAGLEVYLPGGASPAEVDLPDGLTVQGVLDHLGVPADIPRVFLLNHRHAERDQLLADGDTLAVFPPVAGG